MLRGFETNFIWKLSAVVLIALGPEKLNVGIIFRVEYYSKWQTVLGEVGGSVNRKENPIQIVSEGKIFLFTCSSVV